MTGFSRAEGTEADRTWMWELRSVNGRGLEVRLRLPPGLESLEPLLRHDAGQVLRRGHVNANLTLKGTEPQRFAPDPDALDAVLALVAEIAHRIPGAPPPRAEAILALPGVLRGSNGAADAAAAAPRAEALRRGFDQALVALAASRREEGLRLARIVSGLLDEIDGLLGRAGIEAAEQPTRIKARLMESVAALLADLPGLPDERVAQEVALAAARADVREELDRLASHVAGARALLAQHEAVGRRLEFLVQEFNREANTLCSKSATLTLTGIGLELKAAIEQLREQVANIE